MKSDLTFITNEEGKTLKDRFATLIKDTRFFDALVGYFFTSGFFSIYKSLEKTEKIRILIGISTNPETVELIHDAQQGGLTLSIGETRQRFEEKVAAEMEASEDNAEVEGGVQKFIEWIRAGKLEIRAYPTANLHAKLYIMTFAEEDRDVGRVITGSSNFSRSGLEDNLEFNVELKDRADYEFAKTKFDELWGGSVEVSKQYIETINTKTWLNGDISPRELFLKFLYEYFKDDLRPDDDMLFKYVPEQFKRLEYQEQAVLNAKKILDEYGGVFISDVVGLGKTYMSAMLAGQLTEGRVLVIAPPILLDEKNPGSWPNVFREFNFPATFRSVGVLDKILRDKAIDQFRYVFIDEAHRFRTETNTTYEKLAQICRGKGVILVTATPYNNSPSDVLSQIKLFQNSRKSTIPNVPDLEMFFKKLEKRLKGLDRQRDRDKYLEITRQNARDMREKVLKYLMVRRTRKEIETYFGEDLKKQGMKFPAVADPVAILYEFNDEEDRIFSETIDSVANGLKYARYRPLLYYTGDVEQAERQGQINMGRFIKILLIKRLESSFFAFRQSIDRFIHSHEQFIEEFDKGNVYISSDYTGKLFELLDSADDEGIEKLLEEGKAQWYDAKLFEPKYRKHLKDDLQILREIKKSWANITRDPKLLKFVELLSKEKLLKESKLIIFTESKETAEYLVRQLSKKLSEKILIMTGQSGAVARERVIENFDARARHKKDDYRILVTTEVLSEGVNLHRSNVVINYDIPWNPTRMMQRVGRINRVDTDFDEIFTFNFFPTKQANDEIKLREAAEAKIHAFISLLGADARLLTDGEVIESHELFKRLTSKETITGEDDEQESELKYLKLIREIRDEDPDLFAHVKRLPKKARTARKGKQQVITFFRKGKLMKFFAATKKGDEELDFLTAAVQLEADEKEVRTRLGKEFYELLEANKSAFEESTAEEILLEPKLRGGRDSTTHVLKMLRAIKDTRQLTEDHEEYLRQVIKRLEIGSFPKQTTKTLKQELEKTIKKEGVNTLKLVATLQANLPDELLRGHVAESSARVSGPREVILSEYFSS